VRSRDPAELVERARAGDRLALARLLSIIERGGPDARTVGRMVHPLAGHAYTVGLTGSPGSGKSTLTDAVISLLRERDEHVGVLAVDPTSPFTGGAILGDRVRMQGHAGDDGVFIRSMASRGHLGGLALAAPEAVRAMDAAGLATVIIETVGVGQVEVAIAAEADTTVVVVNPGWGDAIQANKAGILEIADVFAVNKADRPGAEVAARDLEAMLEMSTGAARGWRPPVVATVASEAKGIAELWDAVCAHRAYLSTANELDKRRRRRAADELREIVLRRLEQHAGELTSGPAFDEALASVLTRTADPWSAAESLLTDANALP
jgi:LAO/AO transport system kinase